MLIFFGYFCRVSGEHNGPQTSYEMEQTSKSECVDPNYLKVLSQAAEQGKPNQQSATQGKAKTGLNEPGIEQWIQGKAYLVCFFLWRLNGTRE